MSFSLACQHFPLSPSLSVSPSCFYALLPLVTGTSLFFCQGFQFSTSKSWQFGPRKCLYSLSDFSFLSSTVSFNFFSLPYFLSFGSSILFSLFSVLASPFQPPLIPSSFPKPWLSTFSQYMLYASSFLFPLLNLLCLSMPSLFFSLPPLSFSPVFHMFSLYSLPAAPGSLSPFFKPSPSLWLLPACSSNSYVPNEKVPLPWVFMCVTQSSQL